MISQSRREKAALEIERPPLSLVNRQMPKGIPRCFAAKLYGFEADVADARAENHHDLCVARPALNEAWTTSLGMKTQSPAPKIRFSRSIHCSTFPATT